MIKSDIKEVEFFLEKKRGRPTNNPKLNRITVRIDDKTLEILDEYCLQNDVDRGEATRRGINKLKDDLQKK